MRDLTYHGATYHANTHKACAAAGTTKTNNIRRMSNDLEFDRMIHILMYHWPHQPEY